MSILQVIEKVRVLAYCQPRDKQLFVGALRDINAVVAMAGESMSDCKAMKLANVGISLDKGCDIAKDSADLVLMKNNFG